MNLNPLETAYAELLEGDITPHGPALPGLMRRAAVEKICCRRSRCRYGEHCRSLRGSSQRGTWAYRVALNTALAWDRSARNRRQRLKIESHDLSQVDSMQSSEHQDTKILDEFLQLLSKVDRAVMLTFLDGVPNSDAAEIIGLSEGALRVRLHRLKTKFQDSFCSNEED